MIYIFWTSPHNKIWHSFLCFSKRLKQKKIKLNLNFTIDQKETSSQTFEKISNIFASALPPIPRQSWLITRKENRCQSTPMHCPIFCQENEKWWKVCNERKSERKYKQLCLCAFPNSSSNRSKDTLHTPESPCETSSVHYKSSLVSLWSVGNSKSYLHFEKKTKS